MTTKERLLKLFEENRGVYFSGEDMADKLSLSRASIWKAVRQLRNEGYEIDAVTNRGYCLSVMTDILSVQGIKKYLRHDIPNIDISVFKTVSSTNTLVKERAGDGADEGCVILANEQMLGRGRLNRSFYSPYGTGIYLSLLLRPKNCSAEQAVSITTMAAVAMCEAIETVSENKAGIKWVNDIFINGKKVCGILTEGSFGIESGLLEYAVLGIGVNVYKPYSGFSKELESIAGTVFDIPHCDAKNRLTAEFLNRFYDVYSSSGKYSYVEEYRKRSIVIGKKVNVISAGKSRAATVLDIDNRCRLLVKYENGDTECCSSGEISVSLESEK